jgi:hypothetical protein|tara:strand:- start:62 stop:229 length:168 start_codon:yes stop_codon:yes gene_type:complete
MNKVEIIKLKSFTKKSGKLVPLNFDRKFLIKVKKNFSLPIYPTLEDSKVKKLSIY